MLLGHKIGLASAYDKPTVNEMFTEYEKAIDLLTINEENINCQATSFAHPYTPW